jgi:hypothetical protein
MSLTISPQIRIVALVGVLAILGLGSSTLLLGKHGTKTQTTAAVTTRPLHTATHAQTAPPATTPARTTHAVTTPAKRATHHATPARPVAKPATHRTTHSVRHVSKAKGYRGFPVYAQLPKPLQWQLAHHRVVVVSVYNPRSDVDAISVAEAHAGAADAKAGFLLVSVLDNKVAGILTGLLPGGGLLPDPGVLVYRAPGDVVLRLDGFADRAAVAQAATNALHGETGPDPAATTPTPAAVAPPVSPAPTTTTP